MLHKINSINLPFNRIYKSTLQINLSTMKTLYTTFVFLFVLINKLFPQCSGCSSSSAITLQPATAISTSTYNTWQYVNSSTTKYYAGYYAKFSVQSGFQYQWTNCSPCTNNNLTLGQYGQMDAVLTLCNSTFGVIQCSNTSGNSSSPNTSYISWTATYTGDAYLLVTNEYYSAANNCDHTYNSNDYLKLGWHVVSCNLPSAPTGFSSTVVSSTQINLSWNSVSSATDYEVDYGTGSCPWGSGGSNLTTTHCNTCTTASATGLSPNTTYRFIVVAKNSCGWGTNYSCVSATTSTSTCTGISITNTLSNQNATVGGAVTWNVSVSGTSPYTYQWFKNGNQLNGETNSSYTTPSLSLGDNGNNYYCYVTNCLGTKSATSNTATLSVSSSCAAVSISNTLANQSTTVGGTITWSVSASGTSPFVYQWYRNGTQLTSETNSIYTTPTLSLTDNGNTYKCIVTNCVGTKSATSNTATLTVTSSCTGILITNTLSNQSATVGGTVTWSMNVSGTSPFTYQWFKNGSIMNGETNSSYTSPSLNLSDNGNTYYCYVTNCAGTKNATSNSATITVNTSIPSQITINNIIQHNTSFPSPKELWAGYTNQIASSIKICADASKATQIVFVNNTGIATNKIRFLIASDPSGNNSDVSGYFVLSDYKYNGNKITASFTHPKYLQQSYTPKRSDIINIVDNTNPTISLYSIPIEIYRAPVIMVHGIWGSFGAFADMEASLDASGFYPPFLTTSVDYYTTNSKSFNTNSFVIPSNITYALATARNKNFSAGKVDIVAHSMGGILARNYLQSPAYLLKEDIHKIITINTPHSGSQGANLLNNKSSCESFAARAATNFWLTMYGNYGATVDDGAVNDLAVNSTALANMNIINLNNGVVPSHSFVSETTPSWGASWIYPMFNSINPCCNIINSSPCSANGFLNKLFYGEPNDLVVSISSQEGGLPTSAISHYYNQIHVGAESNLNVISEVTSALNINPNNQNYFAQNGYAPVNLNTHYSPIQEIDSNSGSINDGSIKIDYPFSGQYYNPGDSVLISVSSNNGVNHLILEGMSSADKIYIKDTLLSNGVIKYIIPSDAFEKVGILVLGYDTVTGFIDYDTVVINVNNTKKVDSIAINPEVLYVQVGSTFPLNLTGYFNNGNSYILKNSNEIKLQFIDTSIANNYLLNLITGIKEGSTLLYVTYQGQTKEIIVNVLPSDSTLNHSSGIKSIIKIDNSRSLKVFPNPNTGEFKIQFETKENMLVNIDLYNLLGEKVYACQEISRSDNYSKIISINNISSGVYYIRINAGSELFCKKVCINR